MTGREIADALVTVWGLALASVIVASIVMYLWGPQIVAWWRARLTRQAELSWLNQLWERG